jgi:dienelactone hydrolase
MCGRKGLIVAGVFTLLLVGAVTLAFWAYARDPLASLPPPEHGLKEERTALSAQNHRHVEHITLHGNTLGDIAFTLSLPDPLPPEKLPVVLVLGGFVTAEDSIRHIKDAGNNAIVGYAWPVPARLRRGSAFMFQAPGLYHSVMTIPGQVASALHWLIAQPWADAERVSLLGFSLGALAVPSLQDLAAHDGTRVGWTIIAYGGAPLGALLAANPHMKPTWLRKALAPLVDLFFHPLEPTVHLPRLSGKFLVLEGRDDRLIPEATRNLLREAVPEPKTVITFEGTHIGVGRDKMALLQKIIETSKTWLIENGAINNDPD